MAYLIYAKIKDSAVSVVVDNARDALVKMEELAISDHVEVMAKNLSGEIIDIAALQAEAGTLLNQGNKGHLS